MLRWVFVLVLGATGCAMQSGNAPAPTPAEPSTSTAEAKPAASVALATTSDAPSTCGRPEGASRAEQVCWRYRCDGDASKIARWDGEADSCSAGELDADAAATALARINVHRFLAGLAPFAEETAWASAGQACALIADANAKLSHTPPKDWSCWSQVGATASAGSLVANRSVAPSIAAYFEDPGNDTTMVHRRWLLDETLASVGFGSTDAYSCVVVDGHAIAQAATPKPTNPRGWAAWPPDGPVPLDVFTDEELDAAGWTIQSTSAELDPANIEVTVTSNGTSLPITQTHLTALEGSKSAIRFVPSGWTATAGARYAVHVNTATAIDYTVEPTDCDAL